MLDRRAELLGDVKSTKIMVLGPACNLSTLMKMSNCGTQFATDSKSEKGGAGNSINNVVEQRKCYLVQNIGL